MGDFLHSVAELVPPDRRDAFLRSVANRVRDVRVVNAYDVQRTIMQHGCRLRCVCGFSVGACAPSLALCLLGQRILASD